MIHNLKIINLKMSYRQCRNLCQMLRSLNYPRLISLENFSKPNFELIADILYWLTQRYDPQADISDNINEEKDRVEFMKSVVTLFSTKARIKLNPKRLYQADGEAVQEILKITTILYKASNAKGIDEEEAATFSLPTKVSNLKSHKILSNEICDLGARLYDAISRQPELKAIRNQALTFLQGMSGVNSENDQAYIQNCVKQIMQQQNESMQEMTKYVSNMERDQKNLQEKFKKKSAELERAQKRYRNLITVKPAFMQEYERLQQELEGLYQVYVDRYRNIDYLESELERFNEIQREKQRRAKIQIQKVRKGIQDQIHKGFINDEQLDDDALLLPQKQRGHTRGNSRKVQRGGRIREEGGFKESDDEEDDQQDDQQSGEELEDDEDDDDSNF